jgi:hypothetical protein
MKNPKRLPMTMSKAHTFISITRVHGVSAKRLNLGSSIASWKSHELLADLYRCEFLLLYIFRATIKMNTLGLYKLFV